MPNEDDKAVVRRWTAAWNDHDPDAAASLLTESYVRHDSNGPDVVGPGGSKVLLQAIFDAFPNLNLDEAALISEGGLVAVRYVITGTHRGVFNGVPPSGSDVSFDAHDWFRFENGKITEQWVVLDTLGLLQQIGAIPTN
jgi:steroid delta-isomerase-like uncharacterized protein